MRKVLFGIIAILTLFAMISCDNGTTTPSNYTVTYDGNGKTAGTVPAKQTVKAGESVTIASGNDLKKDALNFGGWNTKADGTGTTYAAGASVKPTGNLKLYVKWTEGAVSYSYTVTFDKNGGDTAPSPATRTVQSPSTTVSQLPGTEPTREGYVFKGYNTKADGTGDVFKAGTVAEGATIVTADMVVYAQWKAGYLVTFSKNCDDPSATEPNPAEVELDVDNVGDPTTVPENKIPAALTRNYYTFLGWYTIQSEDEVTGDNELEDYKFTKDTEVDDSFTVYALWKFIGGTASVVDGNLVHPRPLLTLEDDTNGSTLNADGTITMTKTGAAKFKYTFPTTPDSSGYDFVKIVYTLPVYNNQWQSTQIHVRDANGTQINAAGKFASANSYVPLINELNKGLIYELSYMSGGFTFVDYDNKTANPTTVEPFTVKVESVTFYKAEKFKVSFDWNYGASAPNTLPANPTDVENIWGPHTAGHPGYSVGTTNWPVTPDRSSETPKPWFFLGWYENIGAANEVEYSSGTIISKNTSLKAKWTDVEPPKVEKITSLADVGAPIYEFKIPANIKWGNIKAVTCKIYVPSSSGDADTRQFIIGNVNNTAFKANGLYQNGSWGGIRLTYNDNQRMGAILGAGKDESGAAGAAEKWVTLTYDVTTLASSYAAGTGITKVDINTDVRIYYFVLPFGVRSSSAAFSYFIKDVALVGDDDEVYEATKFWDESGYFGASHPVHTTEPVVNNGTVDVPLRTLGFRSNDSTPTGQQGLTREMAYAP